MEALMRGRLLPIRPLRMSFVLVNFGSQLFCKPFCLVFLNLISAERSLPIPAVVILDPVLDLVHHSHDGIKIRIAAAQGRANFRLGILQTRAQQ